MTANDLLGSDSDENEDWKKHGNSDLSTYLYRRVAKGYTKQFKNDQQGSQYIDLKIYNCKELDNVKPKQRWRKSIYTLKMKSKDDSPAWYCLVNFLKEIKLEFKDVPTAFVSSSNMS